MARDRQRAKQRRRRQAGSSEPRTPRGRSREPEAADDATREPDAPDAVDSPDAPDSPDALDTPDPLDERPTGAPDPLEHASADVDQARLAEAGAQPPMVGHDEDREDEDPYDDGFERAPDAVEGDVDPDSSLDPAVREARERRPTRDRGRVLTFLRNCWEELKRVQWPDRRQVGQATAVVLGFVVLAGGYLGLMDALWRPLVEAII